MSPQIVLPLKHCKEPIRLLSLLELLVHISHHPCSKSSEMRIERFLKLVDKVASKFCLISISSYLEVLAPAEVAQCQLAGQLLLLSASIAFRWRLSVILVLNLQ